MSDITAAALPVRRARRTGRKIPAAPIFGLLIVLLLLACAIWPDAIAPYSPTHFDYRALLKPPSQAHWFGTDNFGRDILSRVIWATRVDLQIAVFSTLAPVIVGTAAGALVGYFGGIGDVILLRLVDLVVTLPFLVLVIAIIAVLGRGWATCTWRSAWWTGCSTPASCARRCTARCAATTARPAA